MFQSFEHFQLEYAQGLFRENSEVSHATYKEQEEKFPKEDENFLWSRLSLYLACIHSSKHESCQL